MYPSEIPDEDSILLGIVAKGIVAGTGSIIIHYEDGRATPVADETITMTITTRIPTVRFYSKVAFFILLVCLVYKIYKY